MGDREQLAILRQAPEVWNKWRMEHHFDNCDLSGADLTGADLIGADLSGVDLSGADFSGADLSGANLFKADLGYAQLSDSNLSGANLIRANLGYADLGRADLSGADLSGADLIRARLDHADLSGTNLNCAGLKGAGPEGADLEATIFQGTYLHETIFADVNLAGSKGLDSCVHGGPSTIDFRTLEKSGMLPMAFLRGCGLPETLIDYLPSLLNRATEFYSCFISYSHADRNFARHLHDQLQSKGIRCWLDEHQMSPSDDMHSKFQEGSKLSDKVLLCCSEASLTSWWAGNEIEAALKKERDLMTQRKIKFLSLIPLNLDGYLIGGHKKSGREEQIRARLVADFSNCQSDSAKFESEFEQVVKALRVDRNFNRLFSSTIDLSPYQ